MSQETIFREEALEHARRPGGAGSVLKSSPGWARLGFWLLLGVVIVFLLYGVFGRVEEYARGPARVDLDRRAVTILFPAGQFERVSPGIVMRLTASGRVDEISVASLGPVVDSEGAEPVMGPRAPAFTRVTGASIVVNARLPEDYPEDKGVIYGRVEGRIGSEPVLFALFPGIRDLFDGKDEKDRRR